MRNRNILVSAAAGSGKTATLTERIIQLLTDSENPADISRMLIVTFTRAAAGELRTRISKALSKSLSQDPTNRHIAKQLTALGGAKICTIDSYYLDLVKSNFQRLDLPPSFRLADETELLLLRNETMEAVINRRYESDVEFVNFADQITTAKGEYKLSEQLLEIAGKIYSLPGGTAYLQKCADRFDDSAKTDYFRSKIGNYTLKSIEEEVLDLINRCDRLIKMIDADNSAAPYAKAVTTDRDFLASVLLSLKERDYGLARTLICDYKAVQLGKVTKDGKSETTEYIKNERNEIKDRINSLKEKEFAADPDDIPLYCDFSKKFCLKAKEIIDDYFDAYKNEKANRKICEFSDLRQYALELLIDKNGNPTTLAKVEQESYDHIFVDEYQDTDAIQDLIFNTISNGMNLFLVGDIKQSIYSFRGAEPSVFSKYRKRYTSSEAYDIKNNEPISIFMSENFRCSPNIISFTNAVCSYLFRESESANSGIGYLAEDDLVFSRMSPYSEDKVKVVMIENTDESTDISSEENYVINEIKELLLNGKKPDGSPVMPGDIAILTRSNKEATKMADALAKAGIPRANSTGSDLFENPEVLLMLCILSATDNPQRDIPLAGALRSPIFGFTMSDLINVRVGRINLSLYDSIVEYTSSEVTDAQLYNKCLKAIKKLNIYRREAEAKPVHLFMRFLWNDTNALSFAGSDIHSKNRSPIERRRNLRKFYDYARRFESSSFKGLHDFIEYINGIVDNGTKITDEDAFSDNTVRIMTVHKSKGLEFPIVFITGTNKTPNEADSKKPIVFSNSDDLGIACKISDSTGSFQVDSPFRLAISNRISELSSDEEIRILYVALTRARDKLYIVASGKEGFAEKKLANAFKNADIGGRYSIKSSPRWLDRILIALAAAPLNSSYVIDLPNSVNSNFNTDSQIATKEINQTRVSEVYCQLKDSISFCYPYKDLTEIPAKISVSKLYPELLDEANDSESLLVKAKNLETRKLRFADENQSAAEKGTATHLFLQFCNFDNIQATEESIAQEISRLISEKYLSDNIAKLIRADEILKFSQSSLFENIRNAAKIYRELRFNVFLPASELTTKELLKNTYKDQQVLVQGVIDLCYYDNNGNLILCDYKTDRIPRDILGDYDSIKHMFESAHSQQLKYYSYAVESIFNKKPDKVLIYSLAYGNTFEVNI